MNKKQARNFIKEEVHKELKGRKLNEGIIEKIVDYIIGKLIRKKYGKIIDDVKKDPRFIESELALQRAVEDFEANAERLRQLMKDSEKKRIEYKKKYGKNLPVPKGSYIV